MGWGNPRRGKNRQTVSGVSCVLTIYGYQRCRDSNRGYRIGAFGDISFSVPGRTIARDRASAVLRSVKRGERNNLGIEFVDTSLTRHALHGDLSRLRER